MFAVIHLFQHIICYHFKARKKCKIYSNDIIDNRSLDKNSSDDVDFFINTLQILLKIFMAHWDRKHGNVHSNCLYTSNNKINKLNRVQITNHMNSA